MNLLPELQREVEAVLTSYSFEYWPNDLKARLVAERVVEVLRSNDVEIGPASLVVLDTAAN